MSKHRQIEQVPKAGKDVDQGLISPFLYPRHVLTMQNNNRQLELHFYNDLELRFILKMEQYTIGDLRSQAGTGIAVGIITADWIIEGKVPPRAMHIGG